MRVAIASLALLVACNSVNAACKIDASSNLGEAILLKDHFWFDGKCNESTRLKADITQMPLLGELYTKEVFKRFGGRGPCAGKSGHALEVWFRGTKLGTESPFRYDVKPVLATSGYLIRVTGQVRVFEVVARNEFGQVDVYGLRISAEKARRIEGVHSTDC